MRRRAGGLVPMVAVDPADPLPIYEQLYRGVRQAIVAGRLSPGSRIASTRVLAEELGISRFTVIAALDRLRSEGYLVMRTGSGTFVCEAIPDLQLRARAGRPASRTPSPRPAPLLSQRGRAMSGVVITGPRPLLDEPRPFRPRRPPLDVFPFEEWAKLVRRQWSEFRFHVLDYGEPAGYMPLREAIAHHVAATRGVRCSPEQVIVTSGSQQAFDILFHLLLDPGDAAWMEEPGYLDVRGALIGAGARIVPVPVDRHGMDVRRGIELAPRARLAVVSPSHQYPTGATLSNARRAALLDWAYREGAWIVEDDYDSYFRYSGRPLPALQQMDVDGPHLASGATWDGRVIYVGTFSKTLFPSLRLGFCVVPGSLVDSAANARAIADRNSPIVEQAVLAEFITSGQYDRHLRRTRMICKERYEALQFHAARELGDRLRLQPASAGTHVLGWLQPEGGAARGTGDDSCAARVARMATADGLVLFRLGRYSLAGLDEDALVLGYGGLPEARIVSGMKTLARAVEQATPRRPARRKR